MINLKNKNSERVKRHNRIRNKISGTSERPRLCVYRSLTKIYAQIIDDVKGVTLAAASTLDKELAEVLKGKNKTEQAKLVGEAVAKKALEKKIKTVVFDRSGYVYTGRVEALAEGARAAGLEF
jgi:large subunit ribosomal protein L18